MIATIDTVHDLSASMELLKGIRERVISKEVNDVPGDLMNLRLALIRIREVHSGAGVEFASGVQRLVTQLQVLEFSMIGRMVGSLGYTPRKLQNDLKGLSQCLDDLQGFLARTQTLAASSHE